MTRLPRIKYSIAGLVIGLGLMASAAQAAPFMNGGFETGDFTGWTVNIGGATSVTGATNGYSPQSGTYFALLGDSVIPGTISQTFDTTAGDTYQISYYLANDGDTPNEFAASFNSLSLFDQTNIPAQGYTQYLFTVFASSASSTLTFSERNDPGHLSLDNIVITDLGVLPEAPEIDPGSAAVPIALLGCVMLLAYDKRTNLEKTR